MSQGRGDRDGALTGKTIVVTGAASGIGAATARELLRQGAKVLAVDRNEPSGLDAPWYEADLSVADAIDRLVRRLPSGLDGLCNIAGLPPTEPEAMVLKVNVLGLKRLTLGLIPKLADGAAITHLASLAGIGVFQAVEQVNAFNAVDDFDAVDDFVRDHGIEGARAYFLSKEVVVAWTFLNRWTWRERGIRMNALSPGAVDTPILKDFVATLGERAQEGMRVMDRLATPEDIAPVIAFLQSDAAAWFRGANLTCDGGMSSHLLCRLHGLT